MNPVLWKPGKERIRDSQLHAFWKMVEAREALSLPDYPALHQWSIDQPAAFWSAVWQFSGIRASTPAEQILVDGDKFPGARWFTGARLNFAENLLPRRDDKPALVSLLENGKRQTLSYAELYRQVEQLAAAMRADGIAPGDRVAGLLPNTPEAVVAMLATSSIGAIWSSCSPEFGSGGVLDRFGQIDPKMLFVCDGYYYGGKEIPLISRTREVCAELASLQRVVQVPVLGHSNRSDDLPHCRWWRDYLQTAPDHALSFEQLPFDHPLYIVYSSGTTGQPKCILHSAGGTLIQHMKELRLHTDVRDTDTFFYFTTCGWMMWNWLVSGLACGCTLVLYDGNPLARKGRILLDAIDDESITIFGCSARYIAALEQLGVNPRNSHSLDSLTTLLSTGSPLSPERFDYVYRDFKSDVRLSSISGGTDILSCFVLGNPLLPVRRGEIQSLGLGMAVEVWNENGQAVLGKKGELVCTKPFPSCPLGFWKDPGDERFHKAYFARWPGTWAHGDYAEITESQGVIIHGRSDTVLNAGGVRIGTAEIYRQLEKISSVEESVAIGQSWRGDTRIVLFVRLREGATLDDKLRDHIRTALRENASPRHVPAKILQVADIPRTFSGKIAELAVKDTIEGREVKNREALANPASLSYFHNLDALREP